MIVAMDRNRVIGKTNTIPWRLPYDMREFARITTGNTVVMGRKTYFSLPEKYRPLPNRRNIVLTKLSDPGTINCETTNDVEDVLRISERENVFVMGGGEIYRIFLPFSRRLLVTEVDTEIVGGDTFFPEIGSGWNKIQLVSHKADPNHEFPFKIFEYTR
jgi:dihydrofolate reductase